MRKPEPLTPADSDLSDFGFMPLDVGRFRRSDLVTQEEPEAIVAAVLLWGAAWHSKPAASLSNDDRSLAQAAGFGRAVDAFRAVKEGALRGFIECSDGRLYHPVVAEKAREAWDAKLKRLWRTECARIRKANERAREKGLEEEAAPSFEEFLEERYRAASQATSEDVTRDKGDKSRATKGDSHAGQHEPEPIVTRDGHPEPELIEAVEPAFVHPELDEDEPAPMSHATNEIVARDNAVDSCARAEKGQGEGQGQGQGDSNRLHSVPSIGGGDELETKKPEALVDRVVLLGEIAGLNLTVPAKLTQAVDTLKGWLDEGIDFETTVRPTIESRARENPSEPIYSLRYFDAAVRRAHGVLKLNGGKAPEPAAPPKPREPISREDGTDPRVERFRARLKYAVGEKVYDERFAPHAMAVDVSDNRFLDCFFRGEIDLVIIRSGLEQRLSHAATSLDLVLRTSTVK